MNEIAATSHEALVPYERGLPLSKTVRGVLKYFAPGAVLSLTTGIMFLAGAVPVGVEWIEALALIGGSVGVLSLGFLAGLESLRRWLYPDAKVDGTRSFVAGLLSPLAAFMAGVLGGPVAAGLDLVGVLFIPAVVMAVLMFFAWLTPTPDELRGEGYERDFDALEDAGPA